MALSEGGRDALEAARKRLATAKSQATAAKQMLVHAQSMSDTADKEVKDAQTALNEAEKKYEVIDIDDEPETPTAEGSNKRRKVSVSPQANNIWHSKITRRSCSWSKCWGIRYYKWNLYC